jgi:hypothetical protein
MLLAVVVVQIVEAPPVVAFLELVGTQAHLGAEMVVLGRRIEVVAAVVDHLVHQQQPLVELVVPAL